MILFILFFIYSFWKKSLKRKMNKLIRPFRLRCYEAGCYWGEYNRWPKDSYVWFRPLKLNFLFKATIIRQEKNFLICDMEDCQMLDALRERTQMPTTRVKVHKAEIYDILSAPHFCGGKFDEVRKNFVCPTYPYYRGVPYNEDWVYLTPNKEE
jgi:hypothetical protein